MVEAYPLQWPVGWRRTAPGDRRRAVFKKASWAPGAAYPSMVRVSIAQGTDRARGELARLGAEQVVISSNLRVRKDGLPWGEQREPADPGVAVYWVEHPDGGGAAVARCMAVDLYDRVADNLAAVAATIEAMRAIERHGGAQILSRAFAGFAALPDASRARPWREVLELLGESSPVVVEAAYKRLRSLHHPDKGGNASRFVEVQKAYEQARAELGL